MPLHPFLADQTINAVWLTFIFYLIALLVPLVPAVVIYWLFPEGKTGGDASSSVEGGVGGWKIKAIGAWGAYVTAFLLGYWFIGSKVQPLLIKVAGRSVWGPYEVHFILTDDKGNRITGETLDGLQVDNPAAALKLERGAKAKITSISELNQPPQEIDVTLKGYAPGTIPLGKEVQKTDASEDEPIRLPDVTLKKDPPYQPPPASTPLPEVAGPTPLPSAH